MILNHFVTADFDIIANKICGDFDELTYYEHKNQFIYDRFDTIAYNRANPLSEQSL